MAIYRFVVRFNRVDDPRSLGLLKDARALGFEQLKLITCRDLSFIEGQLSQAECRRLALELLTDPLAQSVDWAELPAPEAAPEADTVMLEVALRPGVTDPVADEIVRAAGELGIAGVRRASTGFRYLLRFDPTVAGPESVARSVAERLLANMVIQRWTIGALEPAFPSEAASSGKVETICVRTDDEGLLAISRERRAALDLAEMRAIRSYCEKEGRDLTDVEFEAIAQTWSEHCGHKTFKGRITVSSGNAKKLVVDSLYKTFIRRTSEEIAAPWVLSAFVDNAGIIDLDGENEVSFKVETHNHPSAIEPFGGANTGVGGVIRDVMGVSHKPIANTDVLCFGMQNASFAELPAGVIHPRRIMSGVVAGVQDYGNKMGIPTVNGAILFDPGYAANPLVFCGTVGVAPKGLHVRTPGKGDRVIVLGGRTGRDGLRGATFSSMTMDAQTGEVSGSSVQIGNPIVEKGVLDAMLPARDLHLYTAVTDCGAGGLSSAVGEMASEIGADVDLTDVRLKYPGLAPWEIWLSEAQERMVLAVPPANLPKLQELCDTYNVELTDIGEFTGSGRLVVRYGGKPVLDLSNEFLHSGIPQRQLDAVVPPAAMATSRPRDADSLIKDFSSTLLELLAHPNIASKASVIRIYDHEVQGGTVVKPLTGAQNDGPSDASVLKPLGAKGRAGIAIASGINPEYGKRDAYRMARSVVDEAIRNAVAVGADPERIAILDNFCWGDPLRPETLGSLVEACRGCREAALLFRTPFISGKDSLNNEYLGTDGQRHAIPPTLLISSIGVMPDVMAAVTMDLKEAGDALYLVGEFQPVFGGSHFDLLTGRDSGEPVPDVLPGTPALYRAVFQAISKKLVRACHDLSEGGLAVSAAEMCLAGRLGLSIELNSDDPVRSLFGETAGCLLVEVAPADATAFETALVGAPLVKLGTVTAEQTFSVTSLPNSSFCIPISALHAAWNTPLQPA
ncbi:MAG TPA: phosphoribosylformylglycinamidine synthase subunit PurL [Anaerolineales bacterium]|nr:phosphoribosylformylglycinamidine synthase subunit PurL [Anaerolineales bacterium]